MNMRLFFVTAFALIAAPVLAGCATNDTTTTPTTDDNGTGNTESLVFKMGTMMPLTGELNNLGPGMQKGAKMAIDDINAANKGIRIDATHEDDTTTDTSAAASTFNLLASRGATGIAGPCCSGITGAVLELAVQNEIVVSSPSATSPALTKDRDNKGYFWRVSPTDEGQGRVLADLVKAENITTVNVIAVNNDYGTGLADIFKTSFLTKGGVVGTISKYDGGATDFSSQITEACSGAGSTTQGVVLVAYTDAAAAIVKGMQTQDCLSKVALFASEGVYSPDASVVQKAGQDTSENWLAAGMKGTTPQTAGTRFTDAFKAKYDEDPVQYSAESYDAVVYLALAALKAGSVDGKVYKDSLLMIANAPGEKCNTFAMCADLIKDGKDIDYVGYAHDLEFTNLHEPASGAYSFWQVGTDGTMTVYQENVLPSDVL